MCKGICPVCLQEKELTMHHVVPRCYVKRIDRANKRPELFGINMFWVCRECHNKIEKKIDIFRPKLARKLGVDPQDKEDERRTRMLLRFTRALVYYRKDIPRERRALMLELIRIETKRQDITADFLRKLSKIKTNRYNMVNNEMVAALKTDRDIHWFIKEWHMHFKSTIHHIQKENGYI